MDELYVLARRVLLDALDALGPHRDAVVLVGAQAVYLRVGEADLAVAPFTTDGDLVIDPSILTEIPPLERSLVAAGFLPRTTSSVGSWVTRRATSLGGEAQVEIDLMVPESVSPGTGRRAARLPGHDVRAARMVRGLEGALVDADVIRLAALDSSDTRVIDVRVAGPAALLVAKLHKIAERVGTDRLEDKDALDVLRLLRGTDTSQLADRYRALLTDRRAQAAASAGSGLLASLFAARDGEGIAMVLRATAGLADPDELTASCMLLASDLIASLPT